ncbi:patatin-like phospholipase family protein [Glaciimonas soli]|uniref:Patatin-like phospholipase family protein n=1 Tax=Glaciimonas soli TaxID=2590999 RepID=A0A843YKU2_9BURK|nr:patatin-like phospholipase family protein [Glaciimonas soli]MQR00469.1 patatin-like phospholipase family protein [Glaciimonas soli]
MNASSPLTIHAGPGALARLKSHGLQAQDVAVIPAAAGGPKGLIFQALDQFLFGHWLPAAPRERTLIGSSIGAWRMAAACDSDPVAAFQRLGDVYCAQRYSKKPSPLQVSTVVQDVLHDFIAGHAADITSHPYHRLQLITARGRGLLDVPRNNWAIKAGFGAATLANLTSRAGLARHLERVVIGDVRAANHWLSASFDAFNTHFAPLSAANLEAVLLASGTLPLVMEPVSEILHAPRGTYWDGGIIDYHLALPYTRLQQGLDADLVLYPHFSRHIVPGWLDKALPWRRAGQDRHRDWMDNVIVLAPSASFLRSLPRKKLPDRKDFSHYGLEHEMRQQQWQVAIRQGTQLRDAFAAFVERPDMRLVQPL